MAMEQEQITIKGVRQGLLVTLGGSTWQDQLVLLEQRLVAGAQFFRGGRAALDVGDRALAAEQIEQARQLLAEYDVELWAVISPCDNTVLAAARMGFVVNLDMGARPREIAEAPAEEEEFPFAALVVERTLRSGQRVHHSGHVLVFGDVHAGAEVVAGGHVVVWGALRGLVHAGAMGEEEARVCALDLVPTQLRIAGYIARSPEEKRRRPVPEMALVRDGRIEAVPWRRR
jgi:septum site-determining protein MinC